LSGVRLDPSASSSAEEDGFLFQGNGEEGLNFCDDGVAELHQVGAGGGAGTIGESQGVAGGDGYRASGTEGEAFGEASVLDQPGCGEFYLTRGGRPVGDSVGGDAQRLGDVGDSSGGDDWVLEEGTGRTGVGVVNARVDDHGLTVADGADGVVDVQRGGVRAAEGGEIGVGEVGLGVGIEGEVDAREDVAVAVGGVEDAVAVGEVAGVVGEVDESRGVEIKGVDALDGLGDLLTVGSYVLDGRGTDEAGDAGETLDAADSLAAGLKNEGVPIEAGVGLKDRFFAGFRRGEAVAKGQVQDKAREAGVGDDEIGAATEDEDWEGVGAGVVQGFEEVFL